MKLQRTEARRRGDARALAVPRFEHHGVQLAYDEAGSGFPLLVLPGGGLNSRMALWPSAVCNFMEELQRDFRVVSMDQRNALEGGSSGPVPDHDAWDHFADDQLAVMDHLGIDQFLVLGCCIGGPFSLKLMERAPDRVIAGVLCQPVGHRPEAPDVMYGFSSQNWATPFAAAHSEVTPDNIEAYLHSLYREHPDFVYSVSREFARECETPMLVLPDDVSAHPYQVCVDLVELAPRAEASAYPWKETPEGRAAIVEHVRQFLRSHQP